MGEITSTIQDHVVITLIPAGTSKKDREEAMIAARKLAKGASSKGRRYKTNWAEYHKKKKALENASLF